MALPDLSHLAGYRPLDAPPRAPETLPNMVQLLSRLGLTTLALHKLPRDTAGQSDLSRWEVALRNREATHFTTELARRLGFADDLARELLLGGGLLAVLLRLHEDKPAVQLNYRRELPDHTNALWSLPLFAVNLNALTGAAEVFTQEPYVAATGVGDLADVAGITAALEADLTDVRNRGKLLPLL